MKNVTEVVGISVLVISCLAVTQISEVIARQQSEHYTWSVSRGQSDKVQFEIDHSTPNQSIRWNSDLPWSNFRGLDPQSLHHWTGTHTFKFARDAGNFICTGQFSSGRGKGSYTYEENPTYVSELQKLGFPTPNAEELLSMLMSDVSLELVRSVSAAGLNASTAELIDMSNRGITADYLREVQGRNLEDFSVHELIEMKNHNVQPKFLRQLKEAGYNIPTGEIIELQDRGVKPEFLQEVKDLGYNFSPREIIQMSNEGVNIGYLRKLKTSGYSHLSAEKIIKLHNHGID